VRRFLAAVLVLALAGVAAISAGAAPGQRIACGIKALDFYFWPKGHPAIPELGFPEFPTAHLEVYTGAPAGKLGQQLAYVSATDFRLVQGCPEKRQTPTSWDGAPMKTLRRATNKLHCVYSKRVELVVEPTAGGFELAVTLGHSPSTATRASMSRPGARLDYDARYCKVVPGL